MNQPDQKDQEIFVREISWLDRQLWEAETQEVDTGRSKYEQIRFHGKPQKSASEANLEAAVGFCERRPAVRASHSGWVGGGWVGGGWGRANPSPTSQLTEGQCSTLIKLLVCKGGAAERFFLLRTGVSSWTQADTGTKCQAVCSCAARSWAVRQPVLNPK